MARTIILSYGLAGHLRTALDRARRFGTDIHLVAAIPSAARGLRKHRSALVTVHDEVGREGLDDALGDGDLVLLLHEDVLLAPEGAQRLLDLAAERGVVAAPRTNHHDVDGAAGTLPPDVVQPLGPPEAPRRVRRVRNVCLAGASEDLRRLLPQRLTAASTRLHTEGRLLLAPDVTATHLDEGRDQLEAPEGPAGRPLLVAAMIVRDEEQFLGDCLASLEGLVDRIEVVDTGSTDSTVEIARAAGANVTAATWRDDFAWARNQALEQCRDAWWVLHVDADERVRTDDPTALRRFLATALVDAEGFDVPLDNIGADGGSLGGQQLPRIFRATGTEYAGKVHEIPHWTDGTLITWSVLSDLVIEHLGYRPDVVADRDKRRRNLDLARAEHATHPTPTATLQLVRALGSFTGRDAEVLEHTTGLLELIRADEDGMNEAGRVPIYQLHSRAAFRTGDLDGAWETIREGVAAFPTSTILRSVYGEIGNRTGHADEVAALLGEQAAQDDARPWTDAFAAATETVQLAVSQLANDDLTAAGATIGELLGQGLPAGFDRWDDVVAVSALSRPDDAIDLLLPVAAADATGAALEAVIRVLDPADAAEFARTVCTSTAGPSYPQREAALAAAVRADDPDALAAVAALADMRDDDVVRAASHGGPRLLAWLHAAHGVDTDFDLDEALARAATGDADGLGRLVDHLATDVTGLAVRRAAQQLPPSVAAPVLARAVAEGAGSADAVHTALAAITVADDPTAAALVAPHLGGVATEVLDTVLTRAAGRGATQVVAVLAQTLLERTGQGTS